MTAPWIAEAERAAAEAHLAHLLVGVRGDYGCTCGLLSPDLAHIQQHQAAAAVAAVVPILAEHFAQAVEAERARIHVEYERGLFRYGDAVEPGSRDPFAEAAMDALDDAARVIREVATPTEGGTA